MGALTHSKRDLWAFVCVVSRVRQSLLAGESKPLKRLNNTKHAVDFTLTPLIISENHAQSPFAHFKQRVRCCCITTTSAACSVLACLHEIRLCACALTNSKSTIALLMRDVNKVRSKIPLNCMLFSISFNATAFSVCTNICKLLLFNSLVTLKLSRKKTRCSFGDIFYLTLSCRLVFVCVCVGKKRATIFFLSSEQATTLNEIKLFFSCKCVCFLSLSRLGWHWKSWREKKKGWVQKSAERIIFRPLDSVSLSQLTQLSDYWSELEKP